MKKTTMFNELARLTSMQSYGLTCFWLKEPFKALDF